jgi:hypothetical protein
MDKHNLRPTIDQLDEAWCRVLVKRALPLTLVDDAEFRKAMVLTMRAGATGIDPRTQDCRIAHRTKMTSVVLPKLDDNLDEQVRKRVRSLIKLTGCTIVSDGWTSIQNRPIVNALLTTPAGVQFLTALDTSGETKSATYIANFVNNIIEEQGPENVVAVCMDGACQSSFPLISAKYPAIKSFICPTHSLDNFIKNVCSDNPTIGVRDVDSFPWGETIFADPIERSWEAIKFITNHQKSMARWRELAKDPDTWVELENGPPSGVELLKYADTRYASKV